MKEFLKYHYSLALLYWMSFLLLFIIQHYHVPSFLNIIMIVFVGLTSQEIRNVVPKPDIPWWKGTLYFVALPAIFGFVIYFSL